MSDTSTEKKIIIALFTALVFTGGAGAFCISIERSVKIARQESPAHLSARAGNILVQPSNSGVVWAYENFRGGRVELKGSGVLSFKTPEETSKQ